MFGTIRSLPRSFFITAIIAAMALSVIACGGSGSGGGEEPHL